MATAGPLPEEITYKCVAAIDFGTTYTGYAFSFPSDKDKIHIKEDWGNCVNILQSFKTPTCVLMIEYGKQGIFQAFGYEAYNKYTTLKPPEAATYCFFTHYKMHLHDTKPLTKDTSLTAVAGQRHRALDVFAMSLQYLHSVILRHISTVAGGHVSSSDVKWVITVPAIWSDASKMFMREAAYDAKMVDHRFAKNLVIALEPEAASLYCHRLDLNILRSTRGKARMEEGTKYLVLDCGGGTLDITAHELLDDDKVRELYKACGEAMGGIIVNDYFEKKLYDILGDDFIQQMKQRAPSSWMSVMNVFEIKKRSLDPYSVADSVTTIGFTPRFGKLFAEVTGKQLEDAFTELKGQGIEGDDEGISFSAEAMMNIYKPAVEAIVRYVKRLLDRPELSNIKHMLIVGGFGESAVLQDALRREFSQKYQILVPSEASLCVLKGAVQFGHSPQSVVERVVRKTYGCKVSSNFNPKKHDPNKTVTLGGKRYAYPVFKTLITQGEKANLLTEKTLELRPITADEKKVSTSLFITDKVDPMYTDEEDVEKLVDISIDLPGHGLDRVIELRLIFGSTHLEVELKDTRETAPQPCDSVNFFVA